eukprot:CAMPEP_0182435792 /NCGR_PEP_ID=MMETSP1167-20130531/77658_1 /TAXON_ID=2988 /ORGANISM="Mallomonas Sp, Strain CCMP3275" /LENGTH=772 /DNA_ID=CAMNT_0024627215 /DNA_START=266 /DNA_END=2584 /DNA_ORIENTATION=-
MPRIWIDYLGVLLKIKKGTSARKCFDKALQALPITQHEEIWKLYIQWAKEFGVPDTAVRVFRRYMMIQPSQREEFVSYLESISQYEEAARQLAICVNDDHYVSPSGATRHQMWMRLCELCASHPDEVSHSLHVDAIIRSGIARFSDEVGRLWCRLADYYIRSGLFEKARDVYEEGIHTVITVRDFTTIFDSYSKFEESVLSAKMQQLQSDEEEDEDEEDEDEDLAAEVEMRLSRLEYLMEKRPILLNSVVLRQNPHNVHEWHKRAKLFKDDPQRALVTYMEAVRTVDPKTAHGRLSSLWIALAKFYERHDDMPNARTIMEKAVEVPLKNVEELAGVWCAWAEMELRHEEHEKALSVMQQAVTAPAASVQRRRSRAAEQGRGQADEGVSSVDRVHRSVKVWNLYLDLEESLGTVDTCRAAYDRAMDLKIITPLMTLNYANYLEENNFFEDSFRVYERAVVLFEFPHVKKIWLTYLDKFMARYEGTKIERLRDLFEQAVVKVPPEDAVEFYIKYAHAEEKYGLARHAMSVYDRATRLVPEARKLDMYRLYIKRVEHHYGITKTRPVYERAISELNDENSCDLCLEFADMERKLGEVDRARAVLQHGSQFADPRRDKERGYWRRWKEFEEAHGNEDTFRDMLRVKRSIETAFSQVNYMAAELLAAQTVSTVNTTSAMAETETEAQIESGQKRKFVAASGSVAVSTADDEEVSHKTQRCTNPDEIDIDDEGEEEGFGLAQREVPAAVFGSAAKAAVGQEQQGALDRFKNAGSVLAR